MPRSRLICTFFCVPRPFGVLGLPVPRKTSNVPTRLGNPVLRLGCGTTVANRHALWDNRISGQMTAALTVYSAIFMRYSVAIRPKNYLLFGCHFINECSQLTQGYRYLDWHHWGGKEKAEQSGALVAAKETVAAAGDKIKEAASN